jgi:hypothetical protein
MEPQKKGDVAEASVLSEFVSMEVDVSIPFGDNGRYDLVVDHPENGLLKLQIKGSEQKDGRIRVNGTTVHTNSDGAKHKQYDGEFDYYAVFSYETEEVYLIEEDEVGTEMWIREEPIESKYGAKSKSNLAEDYGIHEVW